MTRVITHRGLDPSRIPYFLESSREAFLDQLSRGYGLEFDVRSTKDARLVVSHDKALTRISKGIDNRLLADMTGEDVAALRFEGCSFITLPELLKEIAKHPGQTSALHLKHDAQTPGILALLLGELQGAPLEDIVVFDVKLETAQLMKRELPEIQLAPSVAHSYDIERYQGAVGGTLYSMEEALAHRDLFSWVWLDEWDLADKNGAKKKLYTQETFETFRDTGIKTALVTPELHGTSPGLLGGETHEDARNPEVLFARIKEILALGPDAVCTDHPDTVREFIQ